MKASDGAREAWAAVFLPGDTDVISASCAADARAYYGASFRFCRYAAPLEALAEALSAFVADAP